MRKRAHYKIMRKFLPSFIFVTFILVLATFTPIGARQVRAEGCGGPIPQKPTQVKAISGSWSGEVTIYWDEAAYANRYAVAYGVESGQYLYGANDIGGEKARSYTVRYLTPGEKYYFVLAAAHNSCSSPFSTEVSAMAASGITVRPPESISPQASLSQPSVSSSGLAGKQKLTAVSGPKIGEVTLYWQQRDNAENYHLVYGRQKDKFEYGALNIGKITSFTVGKLVPGANYSFALVPVIDGRASYTTEAVKAVAKANPIEVVVTEAIIPEVEAEPTPPPALPTETPEILPPVEETPETYLQEIDRSGGGLSPTHAICRYQLSGTPTDEEQRQCREVGGSIFCGNGWCRCHCFVISITPPVRIPTVSPRPSVVISTRPPFSRQQRRPVCQKINSLDEGWYWVPSYGRDSELVKKTECRGCHAVCQNIGTTSEGWYSSCDNTLIVYNNCGSPQTP